MIDVLCIGTPVIAGDSVGPRVGSALSKHSFQEDVLIIGTQERPVTYSTFANMIQGLRTGAYTIVVDSCIGNKVGTWEFLEQSLRPGLWSYYNFPEVGDACIKCYTAESPLGLVYCDTDMIDALTQSITTGLMDIISKIKGIYRK